MTDPAHPAIYPTGVAPRQKLSGLELKVYDLIVRRFLAAFGDPAVSRRINITVDVSGNIFGAEGMTLTYEGWIVLYKPYTRFNQRVLPELHKGDVLKNVGVEMEEKFTQPPYRYSQASMLAKMEQEKIGTKATRADIISTLFKRNYVAAGKGGIEVTDLGFAIIDSMREFAPSIISTNMTRLMEEELANVEQGSADSISVIEQAAERLLESLSSFLEKEADIGAQINSAVSVGVAQAIMLGRCPLCKKGQLCIIRSRTTQKRFAGCSNYRGGCKATAPLPQKGSIRTTGKACPQCSWPLVGVVFARGTKQWRICVNIHCASKKQSAA
jgi:DNA topoisomerase-1